MAKTKTTRGVHGSSGMVRGVARLLARMTPPTARWGRVKVGVIVGRAVRHGAYGTVGAARCQGSLLHALVHQLVLRRKIVQRDAPEMVVRRPVPTQGLHVGQHRLVLLVLRDVEIADR